MGVKEQAFDAQTAELSVQGDDFTRQMWQMYSAFEDFLERQNDCVMLDEEEPRLTSGGRFHPPLGAEPTPLGGDGVDDYELWSTMASVSRDQRTASDVEEEDNYSEPEVGDDAEETDLIKEGIRNEMERRKLILRLENAEMMLAEQSRHQFRYPSATPLFNPLMNAHVTNNGKSLRRHRHCPKRRRLPAPPSYLHLRESRPGAPDDYSGSDQHLHHHSHHRHHTNRHHLEFFDDKLTQSTPSVNTSVANPEADVTVEPSNDMKRCGTPTIPYGEIPYRRSSAPELLDNPLLETISTIEDLCESDDYAELPMSRCKTQLPLSSASGEKEEAAREKSGCGDKGQPEVQEERQLQQHNSDGDRDSVGYAGSNSVDSGYKSSCPTPELLDPCYYAQGAICNGLSSSSSASSSRRNSKMARDNKSRNIPMGTRAIRRHQHAPRPSPPPSASITSQSPSADTGNSSSVGTGSGSGTSSPSRNSTPATETSGNNNRSPSDYNYYDVNLDHLMYLRQSLLSAIQRCNLGESGNGKNAEENDSDYLFDSTDIRQFMGDPQSRKSWSSLDLRSHSPPLTGSSLDTGNAESAFNDRWAQQREEEMRSLRHQLRSNSLVQVNVHEGQAEQRVSLAGDNAEYYDLESVHDFPCRYGMTTEPRNRASSLVKNRKVKDENLLMEKKALKSTVTQEESAKAASGRSLGKLHHHISDPSGELKSRAQASEVTSSEAGIDRAKFSEVAVCMLKIIEDIQHQQLQQQQQPREAASSPAAYDSERLSGADYHLYEEISYDLAGLHCTAASLLRSANRSEPREVPKQMPPPLPARPNSIFGLNDVRKQHAVFRPEPHAKPTPRPKHLASAGRLAAATPPRQVRRANLYSIFTEQSDRRHISRSLEREWRRGDHAPNAPPPPHFDNMDDEYGFKVMIKQPAARETRT